jgi:hypothetical protein
LLLDFLADACFNSLIFLFGNTFSDLSVTGVSAENERIKHGSSDQGTRDNLSEKVVVGPRDRRQKQIEKESHDGVEQKAKVDSNNDAKEFELSFEAANEESTTRGIDSQDPSR